MIDNYYDNIILYIGYLGMKEEDIDIFDVMSSKRYKSRPSSTMFWALFKYISGVNKVGKFTI